MKKSFVLIIALLAAACSRTSGEAPGAAPSTTSPALPSAAVASTSATPPVNGACAELAQRCLKCPPGPLRGACGVALGAGRVDPRACTNALADKDLKAQCN